MTIHMLYGKYDIHMLHGKYDIHMLYGKYDIHMLKPVLKVSNQRFIKSNNQQVQQLCSNKIGFLHK